jgi:hypothetical protein
MSNKGEVTIERDGKQYGATYSLSNGMLQVKTHTESRSLELEGREADDLARSVLSEIVNAQPKR